MFDRKQFLKTSLAGILPLGFGGFTSTKTYSGKKPVVVSTWRTATNANQAAWEVLSKGGYALDAVEEGVKVEEANPDNNTVGYGGFSIRKGFDAVVTNPDGMRTEPVGYLY